MIEEKYKINKWKDIFYSWWFWVIFGFFAIRNIFSFIFADGGLENIIEKISMNPSAGIMYLIVYFMLIGLLTFISSTMFGTFVYWLIKLVRKLKNRKKA